MCSQPSQLGPPTTHAQPARASTIHAQQAWASWPLCNQLGLCTTNLASRSIASPNVQPAGPSSPYVQPAGPASQAATVSQPAHDFSFGVQPMPPASQIARQSPPAASKQDFGCGKSWRTLCRVPWDACSSIPSRSLWSDMRPPMNVISVRQTLTNVDPFAQSGLERTCKSDDHLG